jgi:hypothetical protein
MIQPKSFSTIILIVIFLGCCCQALPLPQLGQDFMTWGEALNNWLLVEHNEDGTHKYGPQAISVTSYGADGTDTVDDTNAFNAANAVAAYLGWDLVAPAGNYILKDFLFVDGREQDGRTLQGDGDATRFIAAAGSSYVIGLYSGIGAGLERFSIDCNDVNELKAIYFWGTGWRNHITDINVWQNITADSNALYVAAGTYTTDVKNCQLERAHLKGASFGNGVTTFTFTNCDLRTIRMAYCGDIAFTGGVIGQGNVTAVRMYNTSAAFYGVDFEGFGTRAILIDPNLNSRSWLDMRCKLLTKYIEGDYESYTNNLLLSSYDGAAPASLILADRSTHGNTYTLEVQDLSGYLSGRYLNGKGCFAIHDTNGGTHPLVIKEGKIGIGGIAPPPRDREVLVVATDAIGVNSNAVVIYDVNLSTSNKINTEKSIVVRQVPATSGNPDYGWDVGAITFGTEGPYRSAYVNTGDGYIDIKPAINGSATTRMRIKSSGNIGIGKTSPNHKLDVNGVINTSETYKTDGYPVAYSVAAYSAGTAYSLTATPALLDFGTTDPSVVILYPGTWSIRSGAIVNYNSATFSNNNDVTLKLRRTNNTPGDIANSLATVKTEITTTLTGTFQVVILPEVIYTTTNSKDIIQLYGSVAGLPSAGSLDVVQAWIVAERKY